MRSPCAQTTASSRCARRPALRWCVRLRAAALAGLCIATATAATGAAEPAARIGEERPANEAPAAAPTSGAVDASPGEAVASEATIDPGVPARSDEDTELTELQTIARQLRGPATAAEAAGADSPLRDDALRTTLIAAATPGDAATHPWVPPMADRAWSLRSGLLLAELGDAEAAAASLERAIGLGHASREAWHALARMRIARGDLAHARGALLAALDHASTPPELAAIHRDLGELALLERRPHDAVTAFEHAVSERPADPALRELLARAESARAAARGPLPAERPLLEIARFPGPLHERTSGWAAALRSQLPRDELDRIDRATRVLERPASQRTAWQLLVVLSVLGVVLRALRGHGDLAVAIEYPAELRGTFTVRLGQRAPRRPRGKRRLQASADVLKGEASTRSVHTMVSRETQFRRLRPGRYWLCVEGLLQAQRDDEILADLVEDRAVVVRRGRTTRAGFDLEPSEGAVDITVLWDKQPAKDAGVVALGAPGTLRYARTGAVRLQLIRGRHRIAVGSGDRVAVCDTEIDSFQPTALTIDLAGSDAVLFKGCPPAVELYLRGDVPGAAEALEREGQVQKGQLLLALFHRDEGRAERAAEHFERAERWVEAAELWLGLEQPGRAAPLFARAGDPARAAEVYRRAGELLEAGAAFERARDFDGAIDCYREAGATTQWIDALERAGHVFEASQVALERTERRRAIRLLQQVLPEDPRYAEAAIQLARVLEEEGHTDLAAERLADYVRAAGEGASPDVQFHLAELLDDAGETDRSLAVLETLRQREPTYPNLASRIEALRKRRSAELDAETQRQTTRGMRATAPLMTETRYDIREEIGRGGMGVVYRAHDKRLNREVALKRMPENLREHPKAIEFFLREAQAVARLSHRNIVTLYDVDQEDDVFFLTMELLKGHPLNRVLKKKGRIGPRDAARIGLQVAEGLEYAHKQGVVHRDVKTANLFLTDDRVVTIMDFGLAKMTEEVRKGSTVIGGTPFYMAPEQAGGQPVDHRSDLYALGVTLFELVTGRVPFEEGDVAYHHRHTPAPDPRSVVAGVPDALAELILALMAKDPDERPASAEAVRERLDRFVQTSAAAPCE